MTEGFDIDPEQIADLAATLVAVPSPSGQEGPVSRLVADEMERLGFRVEIDALGNVIGSVGSDDGPCVLIDSHTDTVGVTDSAAWTRNPAGERVGDRLYGRGTMDMKGPLAASIYGIAALAPHLTSGKVVVSASVAEEMIEGIALEAIAQRVQPDYVIICEATSLKLARGQRGRIELQLETMGRPTHSSRPELGINAADAMVDVAQALRKVEGPSHPVLGPGILVLTDLISRPYPALSVVPDSCLATYDRRTLPGETVEEVLESIRQATDRALLRTGASGRVTIAEDDFHSYSGAHIQAANVAPAWFYAEDAPIVQLARAGMRDAGLQQALTHYAFCTNGSGTSGRLGIPTVGFGPGNEELAHRVDEYVSVRDLAAAARGYAAISARLLAGA